MATHRQPSVLAPARTLLACALAIACLPASAQDADTAQLRRDIEASLLALGDRNALGTDGATVAVSAPAQVRHEMGAVVMPGADGGPAILAVTPGGAADRLGLKAGDRLVAVNGQPLGRAPDPVAAIEAAIASADGALQVAFERGGRSMAARGQADVVALPAYRMVIGGDAGACDGYVSDQGVQPRSEGVFTADITRIDGRSTPLQDMNRHRVAPGRHLLTVREAIDRTRLNRAQQAVIHRMQLRERADAYKSLVVDVVPGATYKVGARLLRDRLDPASLRDNAYWEPVVWAVQAGACD